MKLKYYIDTSEHYGGQSRLNPNLRKLTSFKDTPHLISNMLLFKILKILIRLLTVPYPFLLLPLNNKLWLYYFPL